MLIANKNEKPYQVVRKKRYRSRAIESNALISFKCTSSASALVKSSGAVASGALTTTVKTSLDQNNFKSLAICINHKADFERTFSMSKLSKIRSQFSPVLDLNAALPTKTHRYPSRRDSLSADSLKGEINYFKPIKTVPISPLKRSRSDYIRTPKAKLGFKEEQFHSSGGPYKSSRLTSALELAANRISAFNCVGNLEKIAFSGLTTEENVISKKEYRKPKVASSKFLTIMLNPTIGKSLVQSSVGKHIKSIFSGIPKAGTIPEQSNKQLEGKTKMMFSMKKKLSKKKKTIFSKIANSVEKKCELLKNEIKSNGCNKRREPSRKTPPVTRSRLKLEVRNK